MQPMVTREVLRTQVVGRERMAEDLEIIRRFVGALVRRERGILLSRVGLQGLLLLAFLLVVAVVAARVGWDRPSAAFLLVILAGVGGWFAVAFPLLRRWGPTGDVRRQARRVEGLAPALRGRLVTAVEHANGPKGQESVAILGLVARRAASVVSTLPARVVHPGRRLLGLALGVAGAWLVLWIGILSSPGGFRGMVRWWTAGRGGDIVAGMVHVGGSQDYARVGDLVLRYTYPAYTGLDSKVVPNSTGDVSGPPGTVVEVSARTGDPVQAAGLVVYGERLEATVSEQGRQVSGRVAVSAEGGTYHLLLYRGAEPERSKDLLISPEEDLPPEVMLDVGMDRIEVPVDGGIELGWRVRDDYGVSRVALTVDGTESSEPLFVAEFRRPEASGTVRTTPHRLGLQPGDSVKLQVASWDNDTVSGPKIGRSREILLVVLGARGEEQRLAARESELLKYLVPILAGNVTEPWPPGQTSDAMTRWGGVVSRRYQPLQDAVERLWKGMTTETYDSAVVSQVVETGNKLVRYTQVAFVPGSEAAPEAASVGTTKELLDAAVVALEDAILLLLDMQGVRGLREVSEQVSDLERAAEDLREILARDQPDVQEMLSRLDHLDRMMRRMLQASAKLAEGGLQEYLNQRTSEVQRLMDEIRTSIAEGELERARRQLERLQRQIESMSQGIADELARRSEAGEQVGEQIGAYKEELQALEEEQGQLRDEVQQLRDQVDGQSKAEAQRLWDRLTRLADEVVVEGRSYRADLGVLPEASGILFNEQKRVEAANDESDALRDAVLVRDIRGAQVAVLDVASSWLYASRAAEGRARNHDGPSPRRIEEIQGKISEIRGLLDQLDSASRAMDPTSRARSEALQQRQQDLERRMAQARQRGDELERRMPVRPGGLGEALDEALQRMQQASEDLGEGQPMQAEGSQGMAVERLRDAREALDQAMEQMREQQQQMMRGQGRQPQEGPRTDGESGPNPTDPRSLMEIPGREAFHTPEAYRRALLEGMEGEVPEEYRALKKRYYEELVHQ